MACALLVSPRGYDDARMQSGRPLGATMAFIAIAGNLFSTALLLAFGVIACRLLDRRVFASWIAAGAIATMPALMH